MRRLSSWVVSSALVVLALGATADEVQPKAADGTPKVEDAKPKAPPVEVTASSDGFALKSEKGDFRLQLRGLVQFDARVYPSDSDNVLTNSFLIRRARPIFQGTVAKHFDFCFTPDFGGGTAIIQDFYVSARVSPKLAMRVGKFKPPIGIEHLQADPILPFVERALAASLQPNRDVGVQASGDLAQGVFSYAVGIFNGTPDGASVDGDTNDNKAVVGRIVLSPFKAGKSPLQGLGLGLGGSTEQQTGATATVAGYRSGGQNSFFSYAAGVTPAGTRTRLAPELSLFSGPVGIVAEYTQSKGELQRTTTSTTTPATTTVSGPFTFENHAWQATATVFLTGDTVSYESVKVQKPYDPSKGQWGGLQLALRVNQLEADADTFARGFADITRSASKATAWAVGLNWYLNKNLKQALSFERTSFAGGAAANGDRKAENALFIRSQLSF